jgi:hypothetical protein
MSWVFLFIYVLRDMCPGKLGWVQKQEVQLPGCHGCCRSWYRYSGTQLNTLQLVTKFSFRMYLSKCLLHVDRFSFGGICPFSWFERRILSQA